MAAALFGVADLHTLEGQYRLSLPLLERALAIYEATLGPDDFRVAKVTNNLGVAYNQLGEYEAARPYFERALAGYERERGNHPDVGEILNNLGTIEWAQGRPAAAAVLYRRALAQLRRTLKEEHIAISRTVFNLGEALLALGRTEEARPLLEQSLTNLGAKLGADHVMLSWPQIYLAGIAEKGGELERAESLLRRAVTLRDAAAAGLDPKDVSAARDALAAFLGTSRPHRPVAETTTRAESPEPAARARLSGFSPVLVSPCSESMGARRSTSIGALWTPSPRRVRHEHAAPGGQPLARSAPPQLDPRSLGNGRRRAASRAESRRGRHLPCGERRLLSPHDRRCGARRRLQSRG